MKIKFFIFILFFLPDVCFSQWSQLSNCPFGKEIKSVAADSSHLFIGTENGFFISTDHGNTWTQLLNGIPVEESKNVSAIGIFGDSIFAGVGNNNLYLSTDNGLTWQFNSQQSGIIKVIEKKGNTIFIGGPGIHSSSDGGLTWGSFNFNKNVLSMLFLDSAIYAGARDSIYVSEDNGITWQARVNGFPPPNININKMIADNSGVYAASYYGVFFTNDNGNNWTNLFTALGTYPNVVSVAKLNNRVFAATWENGIFVSDDNGNSWSQSDSGLFTKMIGTIQCIDSTVYAGTRDGGLFFLENGKSVWKRAYSCMFNSASIFSILAKDSIVLAGTLASGLFRSDDNGNTWRIFDSNLPAKTVNDLVCRDTVFYAATAGAGVYVNSVHGNDWKPLNTGIETITVNALGLADSVIFAGTNSGLFISHDQGLTWSFQFSGKFCDVAVSGNNVAIVSNDYWYSSINYFSNDLGQTWNTLSKRFTCVTWLGDKLIAGTPYEENGPYYPGGGVSVSMDFGQSWAEVYDAYIHNSVLSMISEGSKIYAGMWSGGVLFSADTASSFHNISEGFPQETYRISCMGINDEYIYAGSGNNTGSGVCTNGVWRYNKSDLPLFPETNENSEIILFPNPSSSILCIQNAPNSQIEIFNVDGQIMKSILTVDNLTTIDVSTFACGMYFAKVKSENGSVVKKFVKL